MTTFKQAALDFIPDDMLHICDLPEFSVNLEVFTIEKTNQDGKKYKQNYTELNGRKYQIPNKVLELVQNALKLRPELTRFKASKTGSGLGTKYKVEALG